MTNLFHVNRPTAASAASDTRLDPSAVHRTRRTIRHSAARAVAGVAGLLLMFVTCAGFAASPPEILVRDSFDANTAGTTDLNIDLARQSGALAPVPYSMAGGSGNYGHQLQNGNALNQLLLADFPQSTVSPNFNFRGTNSQGGLKISFDLDAMPTLYGGTPDHWGCINLGLAAADQLANVNQGVPHFGILFRAAGTLQAFDGAAVVSPASEPVYSTRAPGTTNHVDLVITDTDGNPFDGVGNTIIEVYANGGPLPVWTFIKAGGYAENYINLQGSYRAHFDNLEITRLPADATPVIVNPSFEADSFTVYPGYVSGNGPITGWSALGGHGINPGTFGGPFADNGVIPDWAQVAFLQEDGPLSQVIRGFRIGATYQIRYFENARLGGTMPFCEVRIGGQTIFDAHAVPAVGGTNPYREAFTLQFTAAATALQLDFIKSSPQGGDTTLLIDNVGILLPDAPPSITSQPQDQVSVIGETATFEVVALGSEPLSYQWYYEDIDLPGETSPVLEVSVQSRDQAGRYWVVVNNAFGTVESRQALLTVRARVPGLFDTGVDDTGAALPDGAVDPHFRLIVNADSASSDALVQDSTVFPIVAGPWVANSATSKWIGPRFNTAEAAGLAQGNGTYVYRLTFDLTGVDRETVVITGGWAVDNAGLAIRVNDTDTGLVNNNGFGGLTPFTLDSANATFIDGPNTLDFVVQNSDAVAGYTGLYVGDLLGSAELPGTPPSISQQPQSYVAGTGETVTFEVVAAGSSPLSYQWTFNGGQLLGQTSPTLTLNSVSHPDAGDYAVVVSNPSGSILSSNATLTVRDSVPGVFNTGVDDTHAPLPDNGTDPHYALLVNPDSSATSPLVQDSTVFPIVAGPWVANSATSKWIGPRFETSAAAAGDYVYRLSLDLAGFEVDSFVLTGLWATDNEGLDIVVNGTSSGHVNRGQFVSFTPFSLSGAFLAGPNTIDFKLNNADVGYTGLRVENLRGLGTALPPGTAPFIVTQPQNTVARPGETVTLTVRANGSPALSYQWYFDGFDLIDETSATLRLGPVSCDMAGRYTVQVSSAFGSLLSDPAMLTVNDATPPVVTCPADITAPAANAAGAVVNYVASASDPCGVRDFECLPPSGSVFPMGATSVTCTATDLGGNVGSCSFTVTVLGSNQCPTAMAQSLAVAQDSQVSFQLQGADADGDPLDYLVTGAPGHGTLVLQGQTGQGIYTPSPGYCGPDSFKYKVNDGQCESAEATVSISVTDTTPPQITCPANRTVEFMSANGAVVAYTALEAPDTCSGPVPVACQPPSGSLFPIGTTSVVCAATDAAGNRAECRFTVTVQGARSVAGGTVDPLNNLKTETDDPMDLKRLDDASDHLAKAMSADGWVDETHLNPQVGARVLHEFKETVKALQAMLQDKGSQVPEDQVMAIIDDLVKSVRLLAVVAIEDAAAAGSPPQKVAEDWAEVSKGDAKAAQGMFHDAIQHYTNAWSHAARLTIKIEGRMVNGSLRLEFVALPGETYTLEASANLTDWVTLGQAAADAAGVVQFEDREAGRHGARFYRTQQMR